MHRHGLVGAHVFGHAGAVETHSYDAIVVGTGITGGWAAKELCERGLKTLVLERGRDVQHVTDYPTVDKAPWELPYADRLSLEDKRRQPVQSLNDWAVSQATKHWFVDDLEHPYVQEKPFQWTRGYHVGGRSLMWARLCYRWSALDFEANAEDGFGVDWPIRYPELVPGTTTSRSSSASAVKPRASSTGPTASTCHPWS